jgi:hypothetical protein
MLWEGHLGVEFEVKSTSSAAPEGGPAATPPTRRSGGRVVVAVVGVRHYVAIVGVLSRRFELVFC